MLECVQGYSYRVCMKVDYCPDEGSTVDVWSLRGLEESTAQLIKHLSAFEVARANAFFRAEDRLAYIAAHALLRMLLSSELGVPPREVNVVTTTLGKPRVEFGPHFSLSHTRNAVAVAMSRDGAVGVDVEQVSERLYLDDLAEDILGQAELRIWRSLDECRKRPWFYERWVHKESILKALGEGLTVPLKGLDLVELREQSKVMMKYNIQNVQSVISSSFEVGVQVMGAVSCISHAMRVRHRVMGLKMDSRICEVGSELSDWRFSAEELG